MYSYTKENKFWIYTVLIFFFPFKWIKK